MPLVLRLGCKPMRRPGTWLQYKVPEGRFIGQSSFSLERVSAERKCTSGDLTRESDGLSDRVSSGRDGTPQSCVCVVTVAISSRKNTSSAHWSGRGWGGSRNSQLLADVKLLRQEFDQPEFDSDIGVGTNLRNSKEIVSPFRVLCA